MNVIIQVYNRGRIGATAQVSTYVITCILQCCTHILYTFSSKPHTILGKRGTMNKIAEVNDHFEKSLEYRQTLKTFLIVVLVKDI